MPKFVRSVDQVSNDTILPTGLSSSDVIGGFKSAFLTKILLLGCGLEVTEKFEGYDGGVYSEVNDDPEINHEVSIVGWGVDEKTG